MKNIYCKLWFCTNNTKDVYKDMMENPEVEVSVSSPEYAWIRLAGKAVFENNYVRSLLRFYNFNLMKEILGTDYVMNEIFGEDSSWGLSFYNNDLSYGLIKNNQVITKGVNSYDSSYDWKYVRDNESFYSDMLFRNRYKNGNKICHGFPDHALLSVKVNF